MKRIVIIHGAFEHPGRYAHVSDFLSEAGFQVTLPTLRCHGKRPEKTVHVTDFADYVEDVLAAVAEKPDWLMGHSMGGLVALRAVQMGEFQPKGLFLFSPFFDTVKPVPSWAVRVAKTLDRWIPGFTIPGGIDSRKLTSNPEQIAVHKVDPLIRKRMTVGWYLAVCRAQQQALAETAKVPCPVSMFSAEQEHVVSLPAQHEMAELLRRNGKLLSHRTYPGLRHELLNEKECYDILRQLLSDIDKISTA